MLVKTRFGDTISWLLKLPPLRQDSRAQRNIWVKIVNTAIWGNAAVSCGYLQMAPSRHHFSTARCLSFRIRNRRGTKSTQCGGDSPSPGVMLVGCATGCGLSGATLPTGSPKRACLTIRGVMMM